MTSTAYSVPPYVFEQQGTFPAPFTYTVPATLEIRPDTATATFDGTAASGEFLACLTFYSPEGSLLCRMFNPTPVTAGDTAQVTFIPPFGSAPTSSSTGGGNGFQFNSGTYGPDNVGDATRLEFTGNNPADFTQPYAAVDDATLFSNAVNAAQGTLFTGAATTFANNGFGMVAIEDSKSTGNHGASALYIVVGDSTPGGTSEVVGIQISTLSKSSQDNLGIAILTDTSAGAGDSIGVAATSTNTGTGREIAAVLTPGGGQSGAKSLALLCTDPTTAPIFEVRADGSIHGLASVGAITWDL